MITEIKMYYTVYKVTNNINGKFYIGTHKTTDVNDDYMGSGKYLMHSQRKHGIDNFTKEILFTYDNPEEMYAKEAEIVNEEFIAEENTYNLKVGGSGGWDYAKRARQRLWQENEQWADDYRAKLSAISKLQWQDDDYRARMSARIVGHTPGEFKHSDEAKLKISAAKKGKGIGCDNSQFGTCWITNELESKRIKKGADVPIGWRLGRVIKAK
jgi:hypothetical protein